MICRPLFRRELRTNCKILLLLCLVFTLYGGVVIGMYDPKLGESLRLMAESMPDLFAAFGMSDPGSTMLEFLVNYLYGFLFVCFPMVMILVLASRLLTGYIDRGAMAWLLSSPTPRWKLALTQAAALGLLVLLLTAYTAAMCLALSQCLFPGELDAPRFLLVNAGLLGLLLFLAGVCFACACLFAQSSFALGAGGGLCAAFLLLQMLGQVGDRLRFLRCLTPLTLFDPAGIAAGEPGAMLLPLPLYLGAAALFGLGVWRFQVRDLCV